MLTLTVAVPKTSALYLPTFNLFISTVYWPPYTHENNIAPIEFIYNLSTNKEPVIMCDFNLPIISWLDVVPDHTISACASWFLDIFQTLGLHQWVQEPTFVCSGNILDLILTSDPDALQ